MGRSKTAAAENRIQLIRKAQNGDNTACEQLLIENSGLIWSIVRRFSGRGVEQDDLYQLGSLGFVKAVQGFDCAYGTQFSTYAVPKISGEIRRFLRDDGTVKVSRTVRSQAIQIAAGREALTMKLLREPTLSELSEFLGLPMEEIASSENALLPADSLQRQLGEDGGTLEQMLGDHGIEDQVVECVALRDAIGRLEEKERRVIVLRYFGNRTQQQCAKALGISQVQVSRLERRAMDTIRKIIETD